MMDLDELERVVDDLPGELWRARYTAETATVYVDGCDGQVDPIFSVSDHEDHHDIAALVVLRNAAPGLTREVRKLRADLAARDAVLHALIDAADIDERDAETFAGDVPLYCAIADKARELLNRRKP